MLSISAINIPDSQATFKDSFFILDVISENLEIAYPKGARTKAIVVTVLDILPFNKEPDVGNLLSISAIAIPDLAASSILLVGTLSIDLTKVVIAFPNVTAVNNSLGRADINIKDVAPIATTNNIDDNKLVKAETNLENSAASILLNACTKASIVFTIILTRGSTNSPILSAKNSKVVITKSQIFRSTSGHLDFSSLNKPKIISKQYLAISPIFSASPLRTPLIIVNKPSVMAGIMLNNELTITGITVLIKAANPVKAVDVNAITVPLNIVNPTANAAIPTPSKATDAAIFKETFEN